MKYLIYYFSGTGNTKAVVELLKNSLEEQGEICELLKIEDITLGKVSFPDHDNVQIGLAYPIHAGDAPEIIYDFVSLMPMSMMNSVFILNTGADFIHFNDAAAKGIIKRLEKKDYHVYYERTIAMGSNFFMAYPEKFTKQLYRVAKIKVHHMCNELLQGVHRLRPADASLKAIAAWGRWGEGIGARIFGKHLKTIDACTLCEKCVRECPAGNIRRDHDKILFGKECLWCMRCMYSCPEKAIKPGILRSTMLKNGYNIKNIITDDSISGDFVDEATKGFYKHFYRYIQDPSI